jgi:hypothetical protein
MAHTMMKARLAAANPGTEVAPIGLDQVWSEALQFTFADREVFEREVMAKLPQASTGRVLTHSLVFGVQIRLVVGKDNALIWAFGGVTILGLTEMLPMKQSGLRLGNVDYLEAADFYNSQRSAVDPLVAIGKAIEASGDEPVSRSQRRKAAYQAKQAAAELKSAVDTRLASIAVTANSAAATPATVNLGDLDILGDIA